MSNIPYRPIVTEGDPDQLNTGVNEINKINLTRSGPSVHAVAEREQARYAAAKLQELIDAGLVEGPNGGGV